MGSASLCVSWCVRSPPRSSPRSWRSGGDEPDVGIERGRAVQQAAGPVPKVQVEERGDVGALGGDGKGGVYGADHRGDDLAGQAAADDAGARELAEEFLLVGVAVMAGMGQGEE